jgi:acyl-coenzyme A thioesterase PaaI-like protein
MADGGTGTDEPPGGATGHPPVRPDGSIQARPWMFPEPGRLMGRGHPAGDFLEAYEWDLLVEEDGVLEVRAGLPDQVKNPRGQLFGGFTPTYVDLIGLRAVRAGRRRELGSDGAPQVQWMATTSMALDYFEPITGPTFTVRAEVEKRRGRTTFVIVRFFQDGELAVHARLTVRAVAPHKSLGDA